MIQRAGVEPEPSRLVAPCLVDSLLQEILAEALAGEARHQAEPNQLDVVVVAPVQFGKPGWRAIDTQNVNLVERILDQCGEVGIGKAAPIKPVVVLADAVVQEAVICDSRLLWRK
jgi:hypothetical protein